jgi:hypothetical protein
MAADLLAYFKAQPLLLIIRRHNEVAAAGVQRLIGDKTREAHDLAA